MTGLMKMYVLALKLYPRPFHLRFATEMVEVFQAGMEEASQKGELLRFFLCELLRFPVSLAGVYLWSMHAGESRQVAISSAGGGGMIGEPMPGAGWGASFMAGLPHLLIAIFIVSSALISAISRSNENPFGYLPLIVFCLLVLGVLLYSLYKGWKRWSASWVGYIFILVVSLVSLALNTLSSSTRGRDNWIYGVLTITMPLVLAYLLYKTTCKDRLRGLLAAVPPMAIIWVYFQEFVPVAQQTLAQSFIFILAFTATVLMLRTKRFSAALVLTMAVPILGGLPFVYLGVYMGGTLPFFEPGPSLQEVFRQYIPFLAMVLALVLGPQLAVKLRSLGYQSSENGGKIFYRLALGGLLIGMVLTLIQWAIITNNGFNISITIRQVLLIAALALYVAGFALLLWATNRSKLPSSDPSNLFELAALFLPLLFVPILILLAGPFSMGSYLNSWVLPLADIAMVLASLWVIKD